MRGLRDAIPLENRPDEVRDQETACGPSAAMGCLSSTLEPWTRLIWKSLCRDCTPKSGATALCMLPTSASSTRASSAHHGRNFTARRLHEGTAKLDYDISRHSMCSITRQSRPAIGSTNCPSTRRKCSVQFSVRAAAQFACAGGIITQTDT